MKGGIVCPENRTKDKRTFSGPHVRLDLKLLVALIDYVCAIYSSIFHTQTRYHRTRPEGDECPVFEENVSRIAFVNVMYEIVDRFIKFRMW